MSWIRSGAEHMTAIKVKNIPLQNLFMWTKKRLKVKSGWVYPVGGNCKWAYKNDYWLFGCVEIIHPSLGK